MRRIRVFKNRSESRERPKLLRTAVVVGATMAAVAWGGMAVAADRVAAPEALSAAITPPADFVGITPVRVLDTRPAPRGGPIGVPAAGPLGQGQTIDVAVAGVDAIPADAVSVAVNVTIDDDATSKSFLTVWPAGEPRPTSSVNNAEPKLVSPNSGLFKLGAGGKLSVFNQQGAVHVIIDVTGYFVAAPPATAVTWDADAAGTVATVQDDFGDFTGGALIRDLTLPAGSYEITATSSVTGANDGPAAALNTRVRCNLVNATAAPAVRLDTFYQDFFRQNALAPDPGYREALEVGAVVTFAVPTKVELRCYSVRPGGGADAGDVLSSKLIATQVASITEGH
jgi:hypothetical protein